MRRLPSHGIRFGEPPKLQEQETVQLQLSATVAVMRHSGAAARGGTVNATRAMAIPLITCRTIERPLAGTLFLMRFRVIERERLERGIREAEGGRFRASLLGVPSVHVDPL